MQKSRQVVSFFLGRRVSVYFRGGRLIKDKKTDQRFWRLKWAITIEMADARACGGAIQSTYEHMQKRENVADKVEFAGYRPGMVATVFDLSDEDAAEVISLGRCELDRFAMTWADGMTELWIQLEHPMSDALHSFVKDYAFQRFYVEFEPAQRSLVEDLADSAVGDPDSPLQELADRSGLHAELIAKGKTLAEFKPRAAKPN